MSWKKRWRTRDQLKRYLTGTGIEIGALHRPVDLRKTAVKKVLYVDSLPIHELRNHYPELKELPIVSPEIVDDGMALTSVADESLDFIVANHLIEHLENPLLALANWYAKLKPGGVIFMAVPDKRYTFDKPRPLTPLRHLIEDYTAKEGDRAARNYSHFVETAELIENREGEDATNRVNDLIARNYSIHHHVWTFESFGKVLDHVVDKMQIPYQIIDYSSPMPGGNEFIFILGKESNFRCVSDRFQPPFDAVTAVQATFSQIEKSIDIIQKEGIGTFLRRFHDYLSRKISG